MNLQKLFTEKIIQCKELSPGYENHASDVWLVKTENDEVIVRSSKTDNPLTDGPFWGGCHIIFGLNPSNVFALETVNNHLNTISQSIRIPKVIGKGYLNREYIILEKLTGTTLKRFIGQPKEMLYKLGKGIAEIHKYQYDYVGNPLGTVKVDINQFHQYLVDKMKLIIDNYYQNNQKIINRYQDISNLLKRLPTPGSSSYVLVDMDPTQFLTDSRNITGLVDTEAFVIAPRELDFISLEYVLDKDSAEYFSEGYKSILDIPDLKNCRIPYRYLYRLLEIQGDEDLDEWLEYPILFK